MKSTRNFFGACIIAVLFVSLSFLASCVKERDHDIQAAEDATFALWVYDNAINIANEASILNTGDTLYLTTGYCGTVTQNPNQIVVNFDTVNCLCIDGRTRRGNFTIDYTGNYGDSNQTRTITFQDYYVNDHRINGTEIITGLGGTKPAYQVEIDGVIDVLDTLGAITYKAEMVRTWEAGSGTVQWSDDLYSLDGSGQGINNLGNNYAFNTLEPIQKRMPIVCRFFAAGILEVQPQGRTFRSIDFGEGDCNETAIVTIDRKQHNMVLQ